MPLLKAAAALLVRRTQRRLGPDLTRSAHRPRTSGRTPAPALFQPWGSPLARWQRYHFRPFVHEM